MFSTRNLARVFIGALVLLVTICIGDVNAQPKSTGVVTDDDMGIRKGPLSTEEQVVPARGEYTKAEAGSAKNIERSFENSPPLIPHDIEGMAPITMARNQCVECHMPDVAKQVRATPVPRSHLMKLAEGKDLRGKLDNERFQCTSCHVRQSSANPPVKNTFTGSFKSRAEKSSSNLSDTLNEGVKGE